MKFSLPLPRGFSPIWGFSRKSSRFFHFRSFLLFSRFYHKIQIRLKWNINSISTGAVCRKSNRGKTSMKWTMKWDWKRSLAQTITPFQVSWNRPRFHPRFGCCFGSKYGDFPPQKKKRKKRRREGGRGISAGALTCTGLSLLDSFWVKFILGGSPLLR